jgi:hypothetical protein
VIAHKYILYYLVSAAEALCGTNNIQVSGDGWHWLAT